MRGISAGPLEQLILLARLPFEAELTASVLWELCAWLLTPQKAFLQHKNQFQNRFKAQFANVSH
jgi:hypothetical protein